MYCIVVTSGLESGCCKDTFAGFLSVAYAPLRRILARRFEGSQELSWPQNAALRVFGKCLILARHFQRKRRKCLATSESVSPKLSICQNAESGILGPRKFLATFKVSRQNKPLGTVPALYCLYGMFLTVLDL